MHGYVGFGPQRGPTLNFYVGFGPQRGPTLDSYHRVRPPERLYPEFLPVHPYLNLWFDPEEVMPNIAYQKLLRHV